MNTNLDQINQQHAIPGKLRFEEGPGGLTAAVISSDTCTGRAYLHGAHVAAWRPAGQQEALWLSGKSEYADGKAIRGGVPICFPWFGPHPTDPDAPSHGTVRTKAWELVHAIDDPTGLTLTFETHTDPWHARLAATFGKHLTTALHITNASDQPATCEAALHTYFTVGDAKAVRITGLENTDYLDKMDNAARKNQGGEPIVFASETDRVYLDTTAAVTLTDPSMNRRIVVNKLGSQSTVVWNPWADKAARMADFGDNEWPTMCCIETANAATNALTLNPGDTHTMSAMLSVEAI